MTGGKQGLGLEMAMALAEAGASVYCLDIQADCGTDFEATKRYIEKLGGKMEYMCIDVTKQKDVWDAFRSIGSKEGRLDVCVAAAGILRDNDCLDYKDVDFQKVAPFPSSSNGRKP